MPEEKKSTGSNIKNAARVQTIQIMGKLSDPVTSRKGKR
jgi:hypothetical protein